MKVQTRLKFKPHFERVPQRMPVRLVSPRVRSSSAPLPALISDEAISAFCFSLNEALTRADVKLEGGHGAIRIVGSNEITSDGPHRDIYSVIRNVSHLHASHGFNFVCGARSKVYGAVVEGAHAGPRRSKVIGVGVGEPDLARRIIGMDDVIFVSHPQSRKVLLDRFAVAQIFAPGGFSTINSFWEAFTLKQTNKGASAPLFCLGTKFWNRFLPDNLDLFTKRGLIGKDDKNLVCITDDPYVIRDGISKYLDHLYRSKVSLRYYGSTSGERSNFMLNVDREMRRAFRMYAGIDVMVPLYGSARFPEDSMEYRSTVAFAEMLGKALVAEGNATNKVMAISSGGGPSLMKAANEGARRAGCASAGLAIDLPNEQSRNPFIDPSLLMKFKYFFPRKYFLRYKAARGLVLSAVGGGGSMDEGTESMVDNQFNRDALRKLFCFDPTNLWRPIFTPMFEAVIDYDFIHKGDEKMVKFYAEPEPIVKAISPIGYGLAFPRKTRRHS